MAEVKYILTSCIYIYIWFHLIGQKIYSIHLYVRSSVNNFKNWKHRLIQNGVYKVGSCSGWRAQYRVLSYKYLENKHIPKNLGRRNGSQNRYVFGNKIIMTHVNVGRRVAQLAHAFCSGRWEFLQRVLIIPVGSVLCWWLIGGYLKSYLLQ